MNHTSRISLHRSLWAGLVASTLTLAPHSAWATDPGASTPEATPSTSSTPSTTSTEATVPASTAGPEVAAQGPDPYPPPSRPAPQQDVYTKRKGLGGLISGSILLGLGLPTAIVGGVMMKRGLDKATNVGSAESPGDVENNVEGGIGVVVGGGLASFGTILALVGVPLLTVGAVRYGRYSKWKRTHQAMLMPTWYLSRRQSFGGLSYRWSF